MVLIGVTLVAHPRAAAVSFAKLHGAPVVVFFLRRLLGNFVIWVRDLFVFVLVPSLRLDYVRVCTLAALRSYACISVIQGGDTSTYRLSEYWKKGEWLMGFMS